MEVTVRANEKTVGELRGDGIMCKALLEIMTPEIEQEVRDASVKSVIEALQGYGINDSE